MMGRECSGLRLDPSYQRHMTFACAGYYQLKPPSPSRHYYPRLIAGTNLPTPKGWIASLAKADCTHITFSQGYYTIEFKGTRRKWTQVVGSKTNSMPVWPTAPYVVGRELNLRKLPGRQWESSPPSICVLILCVNVCSQVHKILKNSLYGFENFKLNGVSPVLLLLDLDLHFQGQSFGIFLHLLINRKQSTIEQTSLVP